MHPIFGRVGSGRHKVKDLLSNPSYALACQKAPACCNPLSSVMGWLCYGFVAYLDKHIACARQQAGSECNLDVKSYVPFGNEERHATTADTQQVETKSFPPRLLVPSDTAYLLIKPFQTFHKACVAVHSTKLQFVWHAGVLTNGRENVLQPSTTCCNQAPCIL